MPHAGESLLLPFPSLPFPSLPFPSPPPPLPACSPVPTTPRRSSGDTFLSLDAQCQAATQGSPLLLPHGIAHSAPGLSSFSSQSQRQQSMTSKHAAPGSTRGHSPDRYFVEKVSRQKLCILTINDIIPDDTATYYCTLFTVMGYYPKVFGSGTKLTVSDKGNSPPAHSEILQKNHGNQTTYVCLIEKFYPEVIRVTWTDEAHKEVTDNVVQGDPWKATKEGKYSISSWLTVSAANKDKNYHCKYEHESKEHSLQAQGTYYMLRIFILRIIRDLTFSLQ
uniref:Ig-like domain-containing protein n=1 Tax=Aquila chrysaetos chrysaetos TaxID=223781 RepID=A0A663E519_AQUCH